MDKSLIKNQDIDDDDFGDISEDGACICECGGWMNPHRIKCDECIYSQTIK